MDNKRLDNAFKWCAHRAKILDASMLDLKTRPNKRPGKRYNQLKRVYGIDQQEYDTLLKAQDNRCAICHSEFKSKKDIHVDHNHKTLALRGILCFNCNVLLGHAKESTNTLNNAIKYITP